MGKKDFFSRKKLTESKYNGTSIVKDNYVSNVNYEELEVTAEEKQQLIEFEKTAKENSNRIKENLFNLAEIFYEAQKLLSTHDYTKGKFLKWIEEIGFGKSFVYETLDRYNIYLKHKNTKIFELPVRAVREIKKLPEDKMEEVINSDKPTEKLKEIKTISEAELVEEAIIVEDTKEYRLSIINKRLEEIEREKADLLKEKKRLEKA